MNTDDPSRTIEFKVLLALTAAVLLVHIWVLRGTPLRLLLSPPEPYAAFTTRSIEISPVAAAISPQRSERPSLAALRTKKSPYPANTESSLPIGAHKRIDNGNPASPALGQIVASDEARPDEPAASAEPPINETRSLRDLGAAVGAVKIPDSVRIKYQVETNKFPYRLNAELRWEKNAESYDARLELSAFGLSRVQTSHGQITPEGLAPTRFSDKYRSEVAAHFNREKGKVTFSANTPDVTLLSGAQDRLSILVQLASMMAGAPGRFPTDTLIATQTIGPRDAAVWLFTVRGEESLRLPGGDQITLKLVRNPREEFDQKVELWLAPTLGYLPARIKITEQNGDYVDQKWLSTEPQFVKQVYP
ncbi:MAG: DUF3108 domain-containing protein [Comamonadaceae bacterium]